jgi:HEAT repeats
MSRLQLLIAVLCLGAPFATSEAHAWRFGISIGVPLFPYSYPYPYPYARPYYPAYGYYAPYGYPYYYAAPPVAVVGAAAAPVGPVVAQQAPFATVVPVPLATGPAVGPAPSIASTNAPPVTIVQASNTESASRAGKLLPQLNDAREQVRRDAAMDLGRLKAATAVDPLVKMLATDTSPVARDAAARALGLIAAPQSLTALIQAAQGDDDRDVRHSAQFSVEIIRTNLRGN